MREILLPIGLTALLFLLAGVFRRRGCPGHCAGCTGACGRSEEGEPRDH